MRVMQVNLPRCFLLNQAYFCWFVRKHEGGQFRGVSHTNFTLSLRAFLRLFVCPLRVGDIAIVFYCATRTLESLAEGGADWWRLEQVSRTKATAMADVWRQYHCAASFGSYRKRERKWRNNLGPRMRSTMEPLS